MELMKMQTTDPYVEICLRIRAEEKLKVKRIIRNLLNHAKVDYVITDDASSIKDSYSLEEIFPNLHAGSAIRGLRYREGLTQDQLAKQLGVPRRHISEMENGRRSIGSEMAKRLAKELNTVEKVFSNDTRLLGNIA